jgi:hypothetical protein
MVAVMPKFLQFMTKRLGWKFTRQMDEEGLTAQSVVKRAIFFSKIPLLVLEVLAAVGFRLSNQSTKLENGHSTEEDKPKSEDAEVVVSLQLSASIPTLIISLLPNLI